MDAGDGRVRVGQYGESLGAAALLLRRSTQPDSDVLLVRAECHQSRTWGLPTGDRNAYESPQQTALRAAAEQTQLDVSRVRVEGAWVHQHGGSTDTLVLATADGPSDPGAVASDDVRWVQAGELHHWLLAPDLAASWPHLRHIGPAPVLIVDGANVVGSRPDGWWRDRAGAAARLRDQLAQAGARGLDLAALPPTGGPVGLLSFPEIVLVSEGAARTVSSVPGVEVVPAPGSGDDQMVRLAAERTRGSRPVLAVTADRELRRRLAEHDVPTIGPGTLLRMITPAPG